MRLLWLGLIAVRGFAQLSYGVRAGAPLTEGLQTLQGRFQNVPHHWVAGPTVEVRIPHKLGITFDVLYSRLEYSGGASVTGGHWEFPATVRKRFGKRRAQPFVAAGASFNKITGIATARSSVAGLVYGGGVEIKIPLVHFAPELRYTRRLGENVSIANIIRSRQNQIAFLFGVTF